jgi:hypothetical protein
MPVGGYTLRIPKPFFMGFLFGTVPEKMLSLMAGDDEDLKGVKSMIQDMGEQAMPNLMPTALTPVLEQMSNYSFFKGGKLVPEHLMNELPEYRYNPYTSELTKALGQIVSYVPYVGKTSAASPIVIDNYLRAWTGGLGFYALQAADAGLRHAGVLPDPVLPASTLSDIPFIKAFIVRYPSSTAQSIQDFQNEYHRHLEGYNTFQDLMKQGQPDAAQNLVAKNPEYMDKLDEINKAITEHSQLVRAVYKNPDISPDEKRQLIDSTYFEMIEIAKSGNATFKAINAEAKGSQ